MEDLKNNLNESNGRILTMLEDLKILDLRILNLIEYNNFQDS